MRLLAVGLLLGAWLDAQIPGISIVHATIVDGTGAAPFVGTVVIRGERIAIVEKGIAVPADTFVIDGRGYTLTPGFFDLHTHLPYSAVGGLSGDWGKVLKAYLMCGVTSVVDFGTYPETFEPMRRLLREGVVVGPRLNLAARITTPGGHGAEGGRGDFFSLEVTTPAEARAAARKWLAYRPDAIKVFTDGWRYGTGPDMTSMEEETLAAIVKEAHAQGVEVLTHTVSLAKAKIAARAGVDVIAHGIGDAPADGELIGLLRKHGTTYAPTLAVYEWKRGPTAPLLNELLEPAAWKIADARRTDSEASPARQRRWSHLMGNVRLLREAGARFGVGTDAGVTGTYHGWSTLREMELLVSGGLTPLEALTAATGNSAKALDVDSEHGTIAVGKLADLLLIEGVPHENIRDVERVRRIWLGGQEIDRARMKEAIAHSEMTPIPARRAQALIDDMESERTSVDTLRVNATDADHDHSKMMFGRVLRFEDNHAISIQARMAEKTRPFALLWFPLSKGGVEPVDASGFRGVEFEARGEGEYRLVMQRRGVRGFRHPDARFPATYKWTTIQVTFPAPMTDLQSLGFEIARKAGEWAWLELDNLRFY